MKKFVKLFAIATIVGASTLTTINLTSKDKPVVFANSTAEDTTTETTETETTEDELDLSPKAREYTEDELSSAYNTYETITLSDNASKSSSNNVSITGNTITINSSGTYILSGTLTNGQIVVNCKDEEKVQLILNGVSITNETQSPIYIQKAKDYAMITLAEGTVNTLTDPAEYVLEEEQTEDLDAVIYSKDDLIINGTGTLNINANYNDGIKSKDTLLIASGIINITSAHDAIYGKDALTVLDGTINIKTGEGAESKEMKVEQFGNMGGNKPDFQNQSSDSSEMQGQRGQMTPPDFTTNNQGQMTPHDFSTDNQGQMTRPDFSTDNQNQVVEDTEEVDEGSFKGLKSKGEIVINGGTLTFDTYDDSINANTFIEINGGIINIKTGDDGIKSDYLLTINDGLINIEYSYEGIESKVINFNGGDINVYSVDDGINASDPDSTSSQPMPGGMGGNVEVDLENDPLIYINGGNIYVVADGDSIDSNGGIFMNGGVLEIHGLNAGGELALDFDKSCTVTGGEILILGGSANFSTNSTQNVVTTSLDSTAEKGDTLTVKNSSNTVIFETVLEKSTSAITFSTDAITLGETYTITTSSGTTTITSTTTITNNAKNTMGRR